MALIKKPLTLVTRLESLVTYCGAVVILIMGAMITASVLGRAFFNTGVPDMIIIAGIMMIPVIALPLAWVQSQDGHIAVTVTTDWMPARVISALKTLGNVLGFMFFGAIAWFLVQKVPRDIATAAYYDGELDLPVWPMKIVFAVGVGLFLVRLIIDFTGNLRHACGCRSHVTPS